MSLAPIATALGKRILQELPNIARDIAVSRLTGAAAKKNAYTDVDGTSVFRYEGDDVFIDRFFGGTWTTYGPYPRRAV